MIEFTKCLQNAHKFFELSGENRIERKNYRGQDVSQRVGLASKFSALLVGAIGAQAAAPVNPGFFARHDYQVGQSAQGPTGVAVADFNGDGRPDMAVVASDEGELVIMLAGA